MEIKYSRKFKICSSILICITIILFGVRTLFLYRIQLAPVASPEEIVSVEVLDRDIDIILEMYGLKKDRSELLQGEGNDIYDRNYKKEGETGKSIFISVRPIYFADQWNYTEIESLMDLWLYVMDHTLEDKIDGITYYFGAPDAIFSAPAPTEIYMSKDAFLALYQECNVDGLKHHQKVKRLAEEYVKMSGYKRGSGHVQVTR